jgi:hypothetical protein
MLQFRPVHEVTAFSVRTALRTKTPETVETRGNRWQLLARVARMSAQLSGHAWPLLAALGIFCPTLNQNYGSEGWGFESLRARLNTWSEPFRDAAKLELVLVATESEKQSRCYCARSINGVATVHPSCGADPPIVCMSRIRASAPRCPSVRI